MALTKRVRTGIITAITVGVPLMGFLGITQIPYPQVAWADDVKELSTRLDSRIDTLASSVTEADRTLYLKDLENQRQTFQQAIENYEEQLQQLEATILQLQQSGQTVPIHMQQRLQRYQKYIQQNDKRMEVQDQQIDQQRKRIKGADLGQDPGLLIGQVN